MGGRWSSCEAISWSLLGRAEEKRPVDAEDGDVGRNLFVLQDVRAALAEVFVGDAGDGGGGGHFANEQQDGQNHAHFDGDGEVDEDGEQERCEPDADIEEGKLQKLADFSPIAHVVGDHQQDARRARTRE